LIIFPAKNSKKMKEIEPPIQFGWCSSGATPVQLKEEKKRWLGIFIVTT